MKIIHLFCCAELTLGERPPEYFWFLNKSWFQALKPTAARFSQLPQSNLCSLCASSGLVAWSRCVLFCVSIWWPDFSCATCSTEDLAPQGARASWGCSASSSLPKGRGAAAEACRSKSAQGSRAVAGIGKQPRCCWQQIPRDRCNCPRVGRCSGHSRDPLALRAQPCRSQTPVCLHSPPGGHPLPGPSGGGRAQRSVPGSAGGGAGSSPGRCRCRRRGRRRRRGAMVKIGVQQPPAGLKPEKEKAKAAAGGDGAAGTVLLPSGAVSAGRAGVAARAGCRRWEHRSVPGPYPFLLSYSWTVRAWLRVSARSSPAFRRGVPGKMKVSGVVDVSSCPRRCVGIWSWISRERMEQRSCFIMGTSHPQAQK